MKSVMGVINLQANGDLIHELSDRRAVEMLPFAGRYRLIDFALSSLVNSGVLNVGVMLPAKSRSVLDHLRSGKDWDLARRHDGLYYLPMPLEEDARHHGDLKNFYYNIDFFENNSAKYVILASGSFVYNIDFLKILRFHQNTGAQITMVYHTANREMQGKNIVVETEANGLVSDIAEKPVVYDGAKMSLGIYLMEKRIFVEMIRYTYEHGGQDLLLDGIIRRMEDYTIFGCEHDGFVAHVDSTAAYYKANMDLLKPENWETLFMGANPILTKTKDEVPVEYKESANVKNSLVANGCVIRGSVENSIIFRGVTIEEGAEIKNSIVMQKTHVKEDALLENVICDKNVVIQKEKWLKGAANYPLIITKNTVV